MSDKGLYLGLEREPIGHRAAELRDLLGGTRYRAAHDARVREEHLRDTSTGWTYEQAREAARAEHAEQVARNRLAGALRRVASSTAGLAAAIELRQSTGSETAYLAAAIEALWEAREQYATASAKIRG